MDELWQIYDEQGRSLAGQGANKSDVFGKGLLHGASHVWIWRKGKSGAEVLVQKRAATKQTWPNLYDISAAGHINLGETPITAALREAEEEIDLSPDENALKLVGVNRTRLKAENGAIENEFQWLYILELPGDNTFTMRMGEVASVEWKALSTFKSEIRDNSLYVPHGRLYFDTIVAAIERELASS